MHDNKEARSFRYRPPRAGLMAPAGKGIGRYISSVTYPRRTTAKFGL